MGRKYSELMKITFDTWSADEIIQTYIDFVKKRALERLDQVYNLLGKV